MINTENYQLNTRSQGEIPGLGKKLRLTLLAPDSFVAWAGAVCIVCTSLVWKQAQLPCPWAKGGGAEGGLRGRDQCGKEELAGSETRNGWTQGVFKQTVGPFVLSGENLIFEL